MNFSNSRFSNPRLSGFLSIILGAGLIAWSYYIRELADASEEWPSVRGEIVVSDVTGVYDASCHGKTSYFPTVKFRYEVDGIEYTNDKIQFVAVSRRSGCRRDAAEQIAMSYPVGKRVDVFYDPAAPERSVLLKGHIGGPPWGYLCGAMLTGGGIVLLLKADSDERPDLG